MSAHQKGAPAAAGPQTTVEKSPNAAWHQLCESQTVRKLQAAFTVATGLPLTMLPAQLSGAPACGSEPQGTFCIKGCMGRESGRWCLRTLQSAEHSATKTSLPVRFRCPSGLTKILVPVRMDGQHAGSLLVGPFSLAALNAEKLGQLVTRLKDFGLESQADLLEVVWRYSPVVSGEKLQAVITLIGMFAGCVADACHQLVLTDAARTSPLLQRIEALLDEGQEEDVSPAQVANRLRLSACYFCKLFKKQTGLTFTEYQVRKRLEKARRLLLNRQLRVTEVAFEAGFQSIPYFNRAFRRYLGCSPSEYRDRNAMTNQVKKSGNPGVVEGGEFVLSSPAKRQDSSECTSDFIDGQSGSGKGRTAGCIRPAR
ncbi:MAG: helix-turn-helix domain-containing protein [Verrucomicrobia bacterium]|nr:helix-turn-helix domain-containing protein [Verrucomicrobiota bacterium]